MSASAPPKKNNKSSAPKLTASQMERALGVLRQLTANTNNNNKSKNNNKNNKSNNKLTNNFSAINSPTANFAFGKATDGINCQAVMVNKSNVAQPFKRRFEKVQDVAPSTANWTVGPLFINPGNSQLHPIFSALASYYEQYNYKTLKLHYVTVLNTSSGSLLSSGQVAIGVDYDCDDANWTTLSALQNSDGSTVGPAYITHMEFDVIQWLGRQRSSLRNGQALNDLFVNYANNLAIPATLTGSVGKLYNLGKLYLMGVNTPGWGTSSKIGELWVEYEMEMIRPVGIPLSVSNPIGFSYDRAHFRNTTQTIGSSGYVNWAFSTGITTIHPFTSTIGCSVVLNVLNFTNALVGSVFRVQHIGYSNVAISVSQATFTGVSLGAANVYGPSTFASSNYEVYGAVNDTSYPGNTFSSVANFGCLSPTCNFQIYYPTWISSGSLTTNDLIIDIFPPGTITFPHAFADFPPLHPQQPGIPVDPSGSLLSVDEFEAESPVKLTKAALSDSSIISALTNRLKTF